MEEVYVKSKFGFGGLLKSAVSNGLITMKMTLSLAENNWGHFLKAQWEEAACNNDWMQKAAHNY